MRAHLRTAVVVVCTLGLLALFLRQVDLALVWQEVRRSDPVLLLLAVGFTMLTYVLRAIRWQAMLAPIGRTHFIPAFRSTVIGFAGNFLLPGRAGEVLRPYLLARREGLSATAAFATIILERVLDLVTVLFLFGAFVFVFDTGIAKNDPELYRTIKFGGLMAFVIAGTALAVMFLLAGHPERIGQAITRIEHLLPGKLAHTLAKLISTFASGLGIMRQPGPLVRSLAMSLPLWLSIATGIWLTSLAFHITMPFTGSFLIVAVLTVGVAVPTPGAVGGFHYAYRIGATVFFGAGNEEAVGAALVLHAISFVPVSILGVIFMFQDGLSLTRLRAMAASRQDGPAETEALSVPVGGGDATP